MFIYGIFDKVPDRVEDTSMELRMAGKIMKEDLEKN